MTGSPRPGQSWTVLPLLETTAAYFSEKGIESARLDAELLLARVLGTERIGLYTQFEREVAAAQLDAYRALVARRGRREPIAYILGEKEFYSRSFAVTAAVLIPRPETELLAEAAIAACQALGGAVRVLDLGTGSGCLAVTLALACPEAQVTATDCSTEALAVAKGNAERHGVAARIAFHGGDCFAAVPGQAFELVISNPPYVAEGDAVMPDVKAFEPAAALYAGPAGLDAYRDIAAGLAAALAPGGCALFELGAGQAEVVAALFQEAGFPVQTRQRDHNGIERVLQVSRTAGPAERGGVAGAGGPVEFTYEPDPEPHPLFPEENPAAVDETPALEEEPPSHAAAGTPPEPAQAAALAALLDAYAQDDEEDEPAEEDT